MLIINRFSLGYCIGKDWEVLYGGMLSGMVIGTIILPLSWTANAEAAKILLFAIAVYILILSSLLLTRCTKEFQNDTLGSHSNFLQLPIWRHSAKIRKSLGIGTLFSFISRYHKRKWHIIFIIYSYFPLY